jgi:ABC-2 type transport system permease protein
LPVLVITVIFLDFQLPSLPNLILFLVMVVNTLVIMFLIVFNLGLLSFWYMAMWQVDIFFGSLMELFSGRFLPLWFFPQILVSISAFMPFRLMYYVPISIYLGMLDISDCWLAILQQLMWIVILLGITALMWRSAIKKLVIQGG